MGRGVWSCAGMLAAALTCAGVTASVAQTAGPAAEQVAAWTDAHVARRVAAGEAPGAVVAVVYNGAVILQKGYGFADSARTVPMDPERTRVRVGAVSHLATAATALAAAEAGTVRLQQDIHPLWERNGFIVWYKRLEQHRFHWPWTGEAVITLGGQQLNWLLDGYDVWRMKPHEVLHFSVFS